MMSSKYCLLSFVFLISVFGFASVLAQENEARLLGDLFRYVDRRVRPVRDASDPVAVSFSASILRINELNEKAEVLDLTMWQQISWTDFKLVWDPEEYGGVDRLYITTKHIWTPDIVLYNNVNDVVASEEGRAFVSSEGHINWVSPVRLHTMCSVDMREFPFDQQICILLFGSWMYDAYSLNMMNADPSVDLSQYHVNKQWEILDYSADIINETYVCCPEMYQKLQIRLALARRGDYYSYIFVMPAVFVGLLVPLQCFIPPDSEEKLSLGGALFISMVLLLSALNDALPSAHITIPYISIYYFLVIVWIALSLATGMIIKLIAGAKYTRKEVPQIIRQVFLPILKRVLFVDEGPCPNLTELEALSLREDDLQMDVKTTDQTKPTTQDSGPLEKDLNNIVSHIKSFTERQHQRESRVKNRNEWYQLAVACDRFICVLYVIVVVIFSLAIFT